MEPNHTTTRNHVPLYISQHSLARMKWEMFIGKGGYAIRMVDMEGGDGTVAALSLMASGL